MTTDSSVTSINIRPGVSILSVLSHLNYRPWFAIAEFVDNSLQSFLNYQDDLRCTEGECFQAQVSIELATTDGGRISVRDNAAGIHGADFPRAFRPAELPPDRSGLSEFGMGMKSAACWFAPTWMVRTSALGEPLERTVYFDIAKIVQDDLEELTVHSRVVDPNVHYTEIVLSNLHRLPHGRTVGKIKEHLASIYRLFLQKGALTLRFDNDILAYTEPKVQVAPFYRNLEEPPRIWRKPIDFDFGLGLRVHGFAALRETASVASAGFALFRRDRLIQGSADEGYRPEYIFGKSNSYAYQRLFGELHLDGFEVSHTKDGFRWDEHEEIFLALLKEELNAEPLPLLDQAEGHRVRPKKEDWREAAESAVQRTAEVIRREVPPILEQLDDQLVLQPPPTSLPTIAPISHRIIDVELRGQRWQITLELSADPAIGDWIELGDQHDQGATKTGDQVRRLGVRLALAHPFTERFAGADNAQLEPLLRVAAAIALAEILAIDSGVRSAGTFRRNVNELLRKALAGP